MYLCTSYCTSPHCKRHKYPPTRLNTHTVLLWCGPHRAQTMERHRMTPLSHIYGCFFPLNFPARGLEVLVLDLSVPPKTSGIPPSLDQVPGLCLWVYPGLRPTAVRCVSVMHDLASLKPFLTFPLLTCAAIQVQQITSMRINIQIQPCVLCKTLNPSWSWSVFVFGKCWFKIKLTL